MVYAIRKGVVMEMLSKLFDGAETMFTIVCVACLIVFFAMAIDLGSGLYKANQRGELRNSTALKRSVCKFINYEGAMLIAAGVDVLLHLCKFYAVIRIDALVGIPVVCCIVGVFLCIVEFLSVKEKADEKTKIRISEAEKFIGQFVTKKELGDIIVDAMRKIGSDNR